MLKSRVLTAVTTVSKRPPMHLKKIFASADIQHAKDALRSEALCVPRGISRQNYEVT